MPAPTPQERFGLQGVEDFYGTFKEKCVIHTEAEFDVESFKTICLDIYQQIGMRDWGPFTIPVDPYFLELVWEFYASDREWQQLMKREDRTEAFPHLTSVWVRGQEVQVTPEAINSLYWDEQISPHQIICQKIADKIGKEVPSIKWARYAGHMTPPSPMTPSHIDTASANASAPQVSPLPDLLNIAQRAKMHENQLVRLSKTILSMIQSALKKALRTSKDKLTHLCSKVDVLESEVMTLQQEVATITAQTDQPMPCDPEAVPPQGEAPRSPQEYWWVGYHNNADIMSSEEELHHSPPSG
ncbi:hypothetical protein HAX54_047075, partial [Datura stramonium]|nr:hypothetical protein [Datura stramonium]